MGFLKERPNVLEDVDSSALEERLEEIVNIFGKDWLEHRSDHPLQKLWARRDPLATNELLLLGDALVNWHKGFQTSIKSKAKTIRGTDEFNRPGAMFELLGLNLFRSESQVVIPTAKGNAGYDGIVTLQDQGTINLSLKNFGKLQKERLFKRHGAKLKQIIIHSLSNIHSKHIDVKIFANTYPEHPSQWNNLQSVVTGLVKEYSPVSLLAHDVGPWHIVMQPLKTTGRRLALFPSPYSFLFAVPFHKNERRNLLCRLKTACENLDRHFSRQQDDVCHAVLARIHENADVFSCRQWSEAYFRDHPNTHVDGIFLYQPCVASLDESSGMQGIVQAVNLIHGPGYLRWMSSVPDGRSGPVMQCLFGNVQETAPQRTMTNGLRNFHLADHYLFQAGDIYLTTTMAANGRQTGNLRNPASGVMEHSVADINGRTVIISGRFPPEQRLTLFD